jgi:TPP-dependent 2-oxoacid decarboxylase
MTSIPLGLYLFKRLHSLGIRSILGVPGDYNLALLGFPLEVVFTDKL